MTLRYLLDTNICIYIAKKKPLTVSQKLEQLEIGEVAMSVMTYGELLFGAEKSQQSIKTKEILEELITLIPPLKMTTEACKHYANIRVLLEKQGKPIGNNDLWIAAHALALDVTLVTNNLNEFSRIPSLKLENWV
jgi:tRNA(fMet)-specific endonuclease VapC